MPICAFCCTGNQVGARNRTARFAHSMDWLVIAFSLLQMGSTQEQVFETAVAPVVDEMLSGYSCTVFAYGQTGTGETGLSRSSAWTQETQRPHKVCTNTPVLVTVGVCAPRALFLAETNECTRSCSDLQACSR